MPNKSAPSSAITTFGQRFPSLELQSPQKSLILRVVAPAFRTARRAHQLPTTIRASLSPSTSRPQELRCAGRGGHNQLAACAEYRCRLLLPSCESQCSQGRWKTTPTEREFCRMLGVSPECAIRDKYRLRLNQRQYQTELHEYLQPTTVREGDGEPRTSGTAQGSQPQF
jgi:hypothetical protein